MSEHQHEHDHGHDNGGEHDHEHDHDHDHDHEIDAATLHNILESLAHELQEHFGDREPTEEEVLEFLEQRLRSEGRSEEDVQRFMEELRD